MRTPPERILDLAPTSEPDLRLHLSVTHGEGVSASFPAQRGAEAVIPRKEKFLLFWAGSVNGHVQTRSLSASYRPVSHILLRRIVRRSHVSLLCAETHAREVVLVLVPGAGMRGQVCLAGFLLLSPSPVATARTPPCWAVALQAGRQSNRAAK